MKKFLGVITGVGGIGAGSGLPSLVDTTGKGIFQMNNEDWKGMMYGKENKNKGCWMKGDEKKEWKENDYGHVFYGVRGGRGLRNLRFVGTANGQSCQKQFSNQKGSGRIQGGGKNGTDIWNRKTVTSKDNSIVGFRGDDGKDVRVESNSDQRKDRGKGCDLSKMGKELIKVKGGSPLVKLESGNAATPGKATKDGNCWSQGLKHFDGMWVKKEI